MAFRYNQATSSRVGAEREDDNHRERRMNDQKMGLVTRANKGIGYAVALLNASRLTDARWALDVTARPNQ